jgi:trehalose/maltose hydrolase-like predicted phosphorylase
MINYWKTKRSLVKNLGDDITIEGDVKAQQGIRFNIFQLKPT